MSEFKPTPWLYRRLLARFVTETGNRALSDQLVGLTFARLRELRFEHATDSDVLPRALDIAGDLLVAARGGARKGSVVRAERALAEPDPLSLDDRGVDRVDDLLAPHLLPFFDDRTRDWTLSKALARYTIEMVRATAMSHATASDLLTYAFAIAQTVLGSSRRETLARAIDPSVEESSTPDWISRYERSIRAREAEELEWRWMTEQPAGSSLGPHHPIWRKLYEVLERLGTACEGMFAFVIDVGGVPWCIARARSESVALAPRESLDAAGRFYEREIVPRLAKLRRGQRVQLANTEGADRYAAVSFAGIYVVAVWFDEEFNPAYERSKIQRLLPEIQSLTLALPPWPGPGCDEGARRARA